MADAVTWRTGTSVAAELRGPDKAVRVEGSRGTLGRCDEMLAEGPCVVAAPQGRAMVARYVPEACHPLQDVLYACAADSKVDLGVLLFALRAAHVREGLSRQDWVSEQDFGALCLHVGALEQQERFASIASDIFDRLAKAEADLVQLERDHAARLAEFFTHGRVGADGSCDADDEPLGEIPAASEAVAACGEGAGKGQEGGADAGSALAAASADARVAQAGVLGPLAAQGLGILSDPADVAWELAPLAVVRACASNSQWAFIAAAAGPYAAPAYANLVRALDTVMTELSESNDLLSFLPNLSYASSLLTLEQLAGWVGMLDAIEPGTITGAVVRAVLRLDSSFAVLPASVNGLLEGAVRSCACGLGRELGSAYVPCSSGEGLIDLFAHDFSEVTLRSQTQEFSHILADMLVRAAELEGMGEQRGGLGAAVGSALAHDEFNDWQADLVCAALPCEEGAWHEGAVSPDDARWAALGVPPEKLLYCAPLPVEDLMADSVPAFFRGVDRLYMYYFDGRNNSLVRSVIDIRAKTGANAYDIALYMNFQDYQQYRNCENTYLGTLSHYDALSNIVTHNQDTEMDVYLLCLPASYLNAETKWGLGFGISCRPIMPTSTKVFLSKSIQPETPEFLQDLRISREDVQLLKRYNMLSVM